MSTTRIYTADILCEFFEIIIHNILYVRKLYPETIFVPKRKYGVFLYQSIHPEVNEYINEALKAVNFHARKHQLKKLFVCIHSDDCLYEKYVFEVVDIKSFLDSDPFAIELEQFFRSFCLKLHNSTSYLDDLPEDASFSIKILTSLYCSVEFNQNDKYENFPWIEVDTEENLLGNPQIVPLSTFMKDFLSLQIFIEKN